MMKVLFFLGHPAHFHLFKRVVDHLKGNQHETFIVARTKDNLKSLMEEHGWDFYDILSEGVKQTKTGFLASLLKRDWRLFKYCREKKPDILIGTSWEISHIGRLLRIPSIIVNEDDARVIPFYSIMGFPFTNWILAPSSCDMGKWKYKTLFYEGYHELAYLHPNNFTPDKEIVKKYFSVEEPYFIIRFAKLTAHHDKGIRGINTEIAETLVQLFKNYGSVYITSERELEPQFEKHRIQLKPSDIHHVLAFARLYVGDSQTMAAEAGVLGTPFIRFNDFVGKIGYLDELEKNYNLGFGIRPSDPEKLFRTAKLLVNDQESKIDFAAKRRKMLREKVDVAALFAWLLENFPKSVSHLKQNKSTTIKKFEKLLASSSSI